MPSPGGFVIVGPRNVFVDFPQCKLYCMPLRYRRRGVKCTPACRGLCRIIVIAPIAVMCVPQPSTIDAAEVIGA